MSRLLPIPALTALLLGFFCCLASAAKVDDIKEKESSLMELKRVHPNNSLLASEVKAGKKEPPEGYKLDSLPVIDDETGKKIGEIPILLEIKNILDAKSVEHARVVPARIGTVFVHLTGKGGKRLKKATQKMKLGQDRIAVVVEGKCLIAPTVQAVLNREFIITGLDGKKEAKRIAAALNKPDKKGPKK